jgi:hypothetical protein
MDVFIERFYGVLKFGVLTFAAYYYGIIPTIAIFALLIIFRYYFMKFAFGLQEVNVASQSMYSQKPEQRINLTGVSFYENFDAEKIKDVIIKRGIEQIPKLRSKLVKKFFRLYWQEVPLSEAYERVKIIEKPFENEQEFMDYASKQSDEMIDLNELLYTIEIVSIVDKTSSISKGGIILRLDHLLTDGLGLVALTCILADNFKPEIFPPIMKREHSNTLLHTIADIFYEFISILYFPYTMLKFIAFKPACAPYMKNKKPIGQINYTVSKAYNLKDFDNIRKHKLKISFNDMILTVISKSINQICKGMGKTDIKEFRTFVPIGQYKLPTSPKDVVLDNQASITIIGVPAVNDIIKDSKLVAKTFYKQLTNIPVIKSMLNFNAFFAEFIRREDMQDEGEKLFDTFDFATSNVPGPVEEIYYGGCRMVKTFALPNAKLVKLFIPITSYNKQFRITCAVNECIDFDVEMFLKYFDENLAELTNNSHLD